jgi:molybdopterin molybdotransferase
MKDVLGRDELISVSQAREYLEALEVNTPDTELIRLEDSYGRILAEDITAGEDLPGFDRSTMDGFAVISSDTFGASETTPLYLTVKGEVEMGDPPPDRIGPGEAMKIPTGGMLPEGADAVLMFEHSNTVSPDMIEVLKAVAPGENVIRKDEDIRKGEIILERGHRLRPQDVGALGGIGKTDLKVFRKPVISLISTGDEIVASAEKPGPGQVRDINSHNLCGLVLELGAVPVRKGILNDDFELIKRQVVESLKDSDMVIITGGSSVGTRDYIERIIGTIEDARMFFHGVSIKPGKPVLAAIVSGKKPIFGLPGHPAAVTVSFRTFVKPLLERISGLRKRDYISHAGKVKAILTQNISSPSGREDHIRVRIEEEGSRLLAIPVLGKSGLIKTLVRADGLIRIPPDKTGLYRNDEVEVEIF